MNDHRLSAAIRQFLAYHYPGIGDAIHGMIATAIPGGHVVRVQLAAGMIQLSVVVDAAGTVRRARDVELETGAAPGA